MHGVPPEVIHHALTYADAEHLQQITWSFITASPRDAPFMQRLLWRHVRITHEGQSRAMLQRVRANGNLGEYTQSVAFVSWIEDPQLFIVFLRRLRNVEVLSLNIGPLFAPDHLQELLTERAGRLTSLHLRFNPFLREKSYFAFLRGIYFDSVFLTLGHWHPHLKVFSLIHDPKPVTSIVRHSPPVWALNGSAEQDNSQLQEALQLQEAHQLEQERQLQEEAAQEEQGSLFKTREQHERVGAFAQPLVFFKLDALALFAHSKGASRIESLTLRLPDREIAAALAKKPAADEQSARAGVDAESVLLPSLRVLDLSTSLIHVDESLSTLLVRLPTLEHLILDHCFPVNETHEDAIRVLGFRCGAYPLTGVEHALSAWTQRIRGPVNTQATEQVLSTRVRARLNRQARRAQREQRAMERHVQSQRVHRRQRDRINTYDDVDGSLADSVSSLEINGSQASTTENEGNGHQEGQAQDASEESQTEESQEAWLRPIILPSAPSLVSVGLGHDTQSIYKIGRVKSTTRAFADGWSSGHRKLVAAAQRTLREWQETPPSSRPPLMAYSSAASPDTYQVMSRSLRAREMQAWRTAHGLVFISEQDALEHVRRLGELEQPVVCLTPDCAADPAIPHDPPTQTMNMSPEERAARDRNHRHLDEALSARSRRPATEHNYGCAHLARRHYV